jgi:hypothetical protein
MQQLVSALLLGLSLSASGVNAQEYAGRFVVGPSADAAVLEIRAETAGSYVGALANGGFTIMLRGTVLDGVLQGQVDSTEESIAFAANLQEPLLTLVLAEVDAFGQPVMSTVQTLVFERSDGAQVESSGREAVSGELVINGLPLSPEQQAQLEATYGVAPRPGRYWYDTRSGLYGAVGYQAFGFMFPGHEFGALDRDASQGNSGVFVNGRELPESEWLIWSYMLGTPIQLGAYWLDGQGNAGYEGSSIPLVNLYVAAQQNAYSGQGGSGDNFWSTRFSAGNSNADNSQGYVSVPGYGPVGYGF